ncbi:MAG: nucleoid-associated protein [Clostridia bacterium]|nr:nucleoid-associated protein [Clostridia bacterium]NCC42610.1 nucleoid-associated protein [Clostridia bacterium]
MQKEDIHLQQTIIHIMDSSMGMPVLSDQPLDHGSDFGDFVRAHIFRLLESDDMKKCSFDETSEVLALLEEYKTQEFITCSQKLGELLYGVMNKNIDIPPADLLVTEYQIENQPYLALLKMNYKTFYTHMTDSDPWGNSNSVIKQKAILPGENQKLAEAAIIDLTDKTIRLIEKKYDVNGIKTNYFSQLFLQCHGSLSAKTKLAIVTKAVDDVQKKFYAESEQFEVQMETKSIIKQSLEEDGGFAVPVLVDKIFKEQEEMKEEVIKKLDKYNLTETDVAPQNPVTTRKFEKQNLITDTGIEIRIPMEQYQDKDKVDFITNPDGTISVLIKNIGSITSK